MEKSAFSVRPAAASRLGCCAAFRPSALSHVLKCAHPPKQSSSLMHKRGSNLPALTIVLIVGGLFLEYIEIWINWLKVMA